MPGSPREAGHQAPPASAGRHVRRRLSPAAGTCSCAALRGDGAGRGPTSPHPTARSTPPLTPRLPPRDSRAGSADADGSADQPRYRLHRGRPVSPPSVALRTRGTVWAGPREPAARTPNRPVAPSRPGLRLRHRRDAGSAAAPVPRVGSRRHRAPSAAHEHVICGRSRRSGARWRRGHGPLVVHGVPRSSAPPAGTHRRPDRRPISAASAAAPAASSAPWWREADSCGSKRMVRLPKMPCIP
ncbi:MAG: hypothetical protein JWO67_5645 [Streptosporangiaceae bacterium]|nr:hypothetical protein [Streptosporangiaceae bacterium]